MQKLDHETITNDLRSDLNHLAVDLQKEKSNYSGMEKELNERIKQLLMSNETLTDQILNVGLLCGHQYHMRSSIPHVLFVISFVEECGFTAHVNM